MQKQKTLILATLSLLLLAFVATSYAQAANAQTVPTTPNPNSHAPHCIACNTGPNAPPCWSNSQFKGTCGECCIHDQPGPCWK